MNLKAWCFPGSLFLVFIISWWVWGLKVAFLSYLGAILLLFVFMGIAILVFRFHQD